MQSWAFTLIVEGKDLQSDETFDALFEAGCDDALVGRTNGVQYMDFDREALTLADAVLSAVNAVESVPGVRVVRLDDVDLVSMSEIAERTGRTRESIRLLVSGERGPGGFPLPANDPKRSHRVWHWPEVERWMQESSGKAQASDSEEDLRAALTAAIAARHHCRQLNPSQRERVRSLFAA